MTDLTIKTADGDFTAYLALPPAGNGPGLVLIQEIFGVNHVMRDLAEHYAAAGYVTICPDLFWRQEPGIQITDKSEAEWAKAFELYKGFDEAKGVEDLIATLATLRAHDACTGKAGALGYCLGGKLAYLMATRSTADCVVGFYGVGIEAALAEAGNISKPLMLHIAGNDKFCPRDAQDQIIAEMTKHPLVTTHRYEGVDHAFARAGGEHYDDAAATLANARTAAFLTTNLG